MFRSTYVFLTNDAEALNVSLSLALMMMVHRIGTGFIPQKGQVQPEIRLILYRGTSIDVNKWTTYWEIFLFRKCVRFQFASTSLLTKNIMYIWLTSIEAWFVNKLPVNPTWKWNVCGGTKERCSMFWCVFVMFLLWPFLCSCHCRSLLNLTKWLNDLCTFGKTYVRMHWIWPEYNNRVKMRAIKCIPNVFPFTCGSKQKSSIQVRVMRTDASIV